MNRQSKASYWLLLLFVFMNLCRNFLWLIPSVMMTPIMEELGINYAQSGYLVLTVTVLMGVFLFGGNYLLEWISPTAAMLFGLVCIAADGLFSFLGQSFAVILIGKAFSGIGYGLTTCACTALIASSFPKEKLGVINGINACVTSLTITCAYQFIIPLAGVFGSWRRQALFWAGGCIVTAAMFFLWQTLSRYEPPRKAAAQRNKSHMLHALQFRFIQCTMLAMNCLMLLYVYLSSYYPNYLHAVQGLSLQQASAVAGKISVFGMFGSLLMGFLVQKIRKHRRFSITLLLCIAAGFCGMVLLRQNWSLMAAVCVFGMCYSALSSFFATCIMQLPQIPPLAASAGVTMMTGFGSLLAVFVPQIQQLLSERFGLPVTMIMFGILFLPGFVGAALLPAHREQASEQTAAE